MAKTRCLSGTIDINTYACNVTNEVVKALTDLNLDVDIEPLIDNEHNGDCKTRLKIYTVDEIKKNETLTRNVPC
ncbi:MULTISPECIES: hypothetical protein [Clostridium]|uniref:hypothetical protein n=1 Tax=Clostridium TaxID=1485 RepID=UPI000824CCA2|nr:MULTISPECIES: hypothetical protein [Clostridium]PJI09967.1 hypothetical protein CUB90_19765 [Clostridium sp. CT7]